MCVAAVAWDFHPEMLLVAIANRDEFHARPSAPLSRWNEADDIIAGRDLRAGGTWLGVSEAGRFGLLTNFRDPEGFDPGRPSRGSVVAGYLTGSPPAQMAEMNPFNLFYADKGGARFVTNFPELRQESLAAGIHGLSNGPFGEPWPKTLQLCGALREWLSRGHTEYASLFKALRAETPDPENAELNAPAPGYAPIFIRNPVYGTRCSTLVVIARDGNGTIVERSFDSIGASSGESSLHFKWPACA